MILSKDVDGKADASSKTEKQSSWREEKPNIDRRFINKITMQAIKENGNIPEKVTLATI